MYYNLVMVNINTYVLHTHVYIYRYYIDIYI